LVLVWKLPISIRLRLTSCAGIGEPFVLRSTTTMSSSVAVGEPAVSTMLPGVGVGGTITNNSAFESKPPGF
jgi:hypothetical protein